MEERAKGILPHRTSFCHLVFTSSDISNHAASFPAHRQRLVSVQSILSQPNQAQVHYNGTNTRNSSLEQELHQRQLFEYFLVVSLQKSKAGGYYLPEVTQQFPLKVRSRGVLESLLVFCGSFVLKGQFTDFTPKVQLTRHVHFYQKACITSWACGI